MPLMLHRLLRALTLLALMLAGQAAHANCALPGVVAADFGARTSYDLRAGTIATVAVPPTLACNGSVLSLVTSDYMDATATSAGSFQLRSAAGEAIGYRLSADSAGAYAFSQGGTIRYLDPTLLRLLGILNGNALVPTMFAAITGTPNVAAGTYTDTVTIFWSWAVCHGVGALGACVLQERDSGTVTLTVTVTVTKDCRVSAPAVAFGSAPLARQFAPVTQAVAVDCTKGALFTVAFTNGASGAARPWRQMQDGAGHALRYNLYRPDGTTIWDQTNPLAAAQPGTGGTTPALLQTYVARVDPGQTTPPAGTYTDTVSVVVGF